LFFPNCKVGMWRVLFRHMHGQKAVPNF